MKIKSNWLRVLLIILMVVGIFFRFANIDRKVYWGDEVYTSVWISGYSITEMNQQVRDGSILSVNDLQKFQTTNPERNVFYTVKNLAVEDSQHVPLYYFLLSIWVKLFGDSVALIRTFSAVISLLAFPSLYWLCQELFSSPLVGWIAMSLMAVSPAHILYAQEARPYMLWVVIILLSSASLLRATRLKTTVSWGIYALTFALGIYTHVLFSLIAFGHGIYIAVTERFRLSKTFVFYLLASIGGFLTFVPWVLVHIFIPPQLDAQNWQTETPQSIFSTIARWVGIVSRGFLDTGVSPNDSITSFLPLIPLILILFLLLAYSIYFLYRTTSIKVWLFVFTLIGVTGLVLFLPDLILGHRRGTTRFILPCIIGLELSLAYLLATKLTSFSVSIKQQKFWQVVTIMIFTFGVVSSSISSQAVNWWSKEPEHNEQVFQAATMINKSAQPLLISDYDTIKIQVLGYLLDPKLKYQLVDETVPVIPDNFDRVFLYRPSQKLQNEMQTKYNSELKRINDSFWEVNRNK